LLATHFVGNQLPCKHLGHYVRLLMLGKSHVGNHGGRQVGQRPFRRRGSAGGCSGVYRCQERRSHKRLVVGIVSGTRVGWCGISLGGPSPPWTDFLLLTHVHNDYTTTICKVAQRSGDHTNTSFKHTSAVDASRLSVLAGHREGSPRVAATECEDFIQCSYVTWETSTQVWIGKSKQSWQSNQFANV